MRLRGIAKQLEPRVDARERDGGEVHVTGDVLQSGSKEWVVVRTVAIVAHERPAVALWMVILAAAEAVVDEQQCAALQRTCQSAYERGNQQTDLTDVGRRRRQRTSAI